MLRDTAMPSTQNTDDSSTVMDPFYLLDRCQDYAEPSCSWLEPELQLASMIQHEFRSARPKRLSPRNHAIPAARRFSLADGDVGLSTSSPAHESDSTSRHHPITVTSIPQAHRLERTEQQFRTTKWPENPRAKCTTPRGERWVHGKIDDSTGSVPNRISGHTIGLPCSIVDGTTSSMNTARIRTPLRHLKIVYGNITTEDIAGDPTGKENVPPGLTPDFSPKPVLAVVESSPDRVGVSVQRASGPRWIINSASMLRQPRQLPRVNTANANLDTIMQSLTLSDVLRSLEDAPSVQKLPV